MFYGKAYITLIREYFSQPVIYRKFDLFKREDILELLCMSIRFMIRVIMSCDCQVIRKLIQSMDISFSLHMISIQNIHIQEVLRRYIHLVSYLSSFMEVNGK